MLTAAILIGGQARRLRGRFKPLLPVGGRPILARQIDELTAASVEHIALVGRWTVEEQPPLPVVADAIEGAGALGGLYTALLIAPGEAVIVLAGDMPFVGAELLRRLAALGPEDEAAVPTSSDGVHPLCACYRRTVALKLKARVDRGELAVRAALTDLRVRELEFAGMSAIDPDTTMLMNINTLADYQRACRAAGSSTDAP